MKDKIYRILTINPGSTSTKIAYFEGETERFSRTLRHDESVIGHYETIAAQYPFRLEAIDAFMQEMGIPFASLNAAAGRGGLLKPIPGGTYLVNEAMLQDLRSGRYGDHASNLGGILAHEIGTRCGIPAFITDPVVVDEMEEIARLSGIPELTRRSIFHALNQKATARRAARELGKKYEELNLIIAHMGGGMSIAAHRRGKAVDVNNALDGDGPFTPERSGSLPAGDLVRLCFSGQFSKEEILKKIKGKGGMMAYLGTNDMRRVEEQVKAGDVRARLFYEAMAYQVAKEIGAMAAVLEGRVDAILLTGGLAYDRQYTAWIEQRVGFLAPVKCYPGEGEMEALCQGALRVLRGEEQPAVYC